MYTSVGVCMCIITCALIVTDSVYVDLREKEEKPDICEIRLHFSVCAHTEYEKSSYRKNTPIHVFFALFYLKQRSANDCPAS